VALNLLMSRVKIHGLSYQSAKANDGSASDNAGGDVTGTPVPILSIYSSFRKKSDRPDRKKVEALTEIMKTQPRWWVGT
jgi:hypothetical protein